MRNDLGKRLFILLLIFLFAAIFFLSRREPQVEELPKSALTLENQTLSIRSTDDGAVYVDGEGTLTADDLGMLMKNAKLKVRDVNDMFLGDGITEIGFNAINGYTYMETLKLGAGTQYVNNGAVRNCTALKYIYVPKGVKRLGRDFLYSCGDVIVVTDGTLDDLPKMKNVSNGRVLTEVDSLDVLLEKRARVPWATYSATALDSTDGQPTEPPMKLRPDCLQYGPFTTMQAGQYIVRIEGAGFDGLAEEDPDVYYSGTTIPIANVAIENNAIEYRVRFDQDTSRVEYRLHNGTDSDIEISRIVVYNTDFEVSDKCEQWWQ